MLHRSLNPQVPSKGRHSEPAETVLLPAHALHTSAWPLLISCGTSA